MRVAKAGRYTRCLVCGPPQWFPLRVSAERSTG